MHAMLIHYITLTAPSLVAEKTMPKKAFTVQIDDVIARISKCSAGLRALLVTGYDDASFKTKIIKTVAGCDTAMKILARMSVERERQMVSVFDDFDCILNAMSGAIDRGYCPVGAYYIAMWKIISRACESTDKIRSYGTDFYTAGAWVPGCLGGWGMPTIAAIVSRTAVNSVDAEIGTLFTLNACLREGEVKTAHSQIVNNMLSQTT
eukprot:6486252-Amphidinium_carterae.1